MRIVVAHGASVNVHQHRQAIHSAGLACDAGDCVSWAQLPTRLGGAPADLVVLLAENGQEIPWDRIDEAIQLRRCPVMLVGGGETDQEAAQKLGVTRQIERDEFQHEMDRMSQENDASPGAVLTVVAPLAGSGGSTISCNLAGGFAGSEGNVALMELTQNRSKLAVMLDVTPAGTIEEACQRRDSLDAMRLRNMAHEHSSGVALLLGSPDGESNEHLNPNSARRLAILSRVAFDYTVISYSPNEWDETQQVVLQCSDAILVVTRADVLSLHRTKQWLQWITPWGVDDRVKLVVNRWGQAGQLSARQVESSLGREIAGWIPEDPKRVNMAVNQGKLIRELSSLSGVQRKLASLASTLNGKALSVS